MLRRECPGILPQLDTHSMAYTPTQRPSSWHPPEARHSFVIRNSPFIIRAAGETARNDELFPPAARRYTPPIDRLPRSRTRRHEALRVRPHAMRGRGSGSGGKPSSPPWLSHVPWVAGPERIDAECATERKGHQPSAFSHQQLDGLGVIWSATTDRHADATAIGMAPG